MKRVYVEFTYTVHESMTLEISDDLEMRLTGLDAEMNDAPPEVQQQAYVELAAEVKRASGVSGDVVISGAEPR